MRAQSRFMTSGKLLGHNHAPERAHPPPLPAWLRHILGVLLVDLLPSPLHNRAHDEGQADEYRAT